MDDIWCPKKIVTCKCECIHLLRIMYTLDSLFEGDTSQIHEWMCNYNYHLVGKPIKLIKKSEGLHRVWSYLERISSN